MTIAELEETLKEEARLFLARGRGLRTPHTEDLFARRLYIAPEEIRVENYLRKRPLAAFNPGAALADGVVHLFPRLVFDYYSYASAIGHAALPLEDLLKGCIPRPIPVRIVLYPTELYEAVRGCEDARAHWTGGGFTLFYTAVGKPGDFRNTDSKDAFVPALALAELGEDLSLRRKGLIRIGLGEEAGLDLYIPTKNATLLQGEAFLLRPSLTGLPDLCWRGRLDRGRLRAYDLRPVLPPEPFEYKVGWSTNALPLEDGTYLVGFHGILRHDLSYRHGLARLSPEGELLGVSHYLLAPQGLQESFGDRPLTLYGNGLLLHGEELVWIGGVGDYAIGVFTAPLEEVLRRITPV